MKLYIIRHGETDWNKEKRLQGQSDIPLNDYGRELARITGKALKDVHFDYVFSSPLSRVSCSLTIVSWLLFFLPNNPKNPILSLFFTTLLQK